MLLSGSLANVITCVGKRGEKEERWWLQQRQWDAGPSFPVQNTLRIGLGRPWFRGLISIPWVPWSECVLK